VTDDQLIDKTLAGDTAAFGDLVQKYQDRLFHSISHVLGSVQDAEDVLQETFVQAFLKLESFQRTAAFYTWIYRIALNTAISLRRRKSARISIDQMHADTGQEPHDPGPPPDGRLRQQERADQVHVALAALAEEHRTVLVLREMDDCSYEEIAEILDLPVGTVRSRLHRARTQFKDQMKQVLQEDLTQP
jgi:RNA polymerase sigma-70 factor, ECF subfamily